MAAAQPAAQISVTVNADGGHREDVGRLLIFFWSLKKSSHGGVDLADRRCRECLSAAFQSTADNAISRQVVTAMVRSWRWSTMFGVFGVHAILIGGIAVFM
ncbi:hypothetical protein KXS15_24540 [Sinorhizobium meliloti]|uniref:hypothetical protein n=1 Tax=Rhizobium meliloti TaxID=382 RepID=UPI003F174D7F